jgi:hypothetical protein
MVDIRNLYPRSLQVKRNMKRRSFFAWLIAPIVARFAPKDRDFVITKVEADSFEMSLAPEKVSFGFDPSSGKDYTVLSTWEWKTDPKTGVAIPELRHSRINDCDFYY